MGTLNVIVTDDRHGSYDTEREILKRVDAKLTIFNCKSETELIKAVKDADGVLANMSNINLNVINAMKKCRIISRYGTGYDNVDIKAAEQKGIWVSRVPDYCYEEVADHALALLLSCIRRISFTDKKIRQGDWNIHPGQRISRIKGKTLGIIGYGGTGRSFYKKASALGFGRVLICDNRVTTHDIASGEVEIAPIDTLLREADYISLHIPMREDNYHFINKESFMKMKDNVIVVNTSRGGIMDYNALIDALKNGKVDSAGLDVFEEKPPLRSDLINMDNVVLSDHNAYFSEESIIELKTKAAENIVEVLSGRPPVSPVNCPDAE